MKAMFAWPGRGVRPSNKQVYHTMEFVRTFVGVHDEEMPLGSVSLRGSRTLVQHDLGVLKDILRGLSK